MRDAVETYQQRKSEFADYEYLQQFEPDSDGIRMQPDLTFLRMQQVYDKEPVPDGIKGDRQMRSYLSTDLLDGNLTRERLQRGLTRDEINDLVNYMGWYMYDFLALRVSEGRSEMIPRQEYEGTGIAWTTTRYGEWYKVLVDALGIDGLIELGSQKRREMGSQVRAGGTLHMLTSPPFGGIALSLQEMIDPEDPVYTEWMRYFYTVPLAIQYGLTGESGYLAPCQNRYVTDYKHDDVVDFAKEHLEPIEGQEKAALRAFMASGELFSFLMHYDNRTGMDDHGPYLVEDGKPMIIRDIWLSDPFLPWNDIAESRDLPYCVSVAFVIDPAAMDLEELRVTHNVMTEPANYLDAVESAAVFIREQPEQAERLPLDDIEVGEIDDLAEIRSKVDAGTEEWYRRTARLSRREKIMNGAVTYSVGFIEPYLQGTGAYEYFCDEFDLWEVPPMISTRYYKFHDPDAYEFFANNLFMGIGWPELTDTPNEESGYADYLEESRDELGWQSDLTGMQEVPEYYEEKMNEYGVLDVPITKGDSDVHSWELGEYLESL